MSCISEILKIKGDKEFLKVSDSLVIEDGGIYKGYEYLITFVGTMAHRCGYVEISSDNKLYDKDFMSIDNDSNLLVHGGITFYEPRPHIFKKIIKLKSVCMNKWMGFDAMHAGDCPDIEGYKQYFEASPNEIIMIEETSKILNDVGCIIRTKDYMVEQCKNLIDQIIEINK